MIIVIFFDLIIACKKCLLESWRQSTHACLCTWSGWYQLCLILNQENQEKSNTSINTSNGMKWINLYRNGRFFKSLTITHVYQVWQSRIHCFLEIWKRCQTKWQHKSWSINWYSVNIHTRQITSQDCESKINKVKQGKELKTLTYTDVNCSTEKKMETIQP